MRILFTACPMYGHVNPVLPLVLAARAAGHDVVVATGPDMAARLTVPTWAVGPSHCEAGSPGTDWLAYFASTARARAADLVPRALDWKPDLPHTLLLPRCTAVVSQAGAGIMFGSLAHGLPHLALPQGGDQFTNAEAIERSGTGLALHPAEVTGAAITDRLTELLTNSTFAAAAASIRTDLTAKPDATTVLPTLTTEAASW
ncbi:glycosyltransferase [Dactylosporangium sp. NPDC000521]|uniref:glycosyltransferase n=1 Tax=Dactylosporangium sp. NPDC000521 TaxID=3363975 RepID=UPI0036C87B5C